MFPPFFNATSTARVLSLLLHFLKQIFSGPHFQDIAYQPKGGKSLKGVGEVWRGRGELSRESFPRPLQIPNALPGRFPQGAKAAEHIRQHVFKQALRIAGSGGKHEGA